MPWIFPGNAEAAGLGDETIVGPWPGGWLIGGVCGLSGSAVMTAAVASRSRVRLLNIPPYRRYRMPDEVQAQPFAHDPGLGIHWKSRRRDRQRIDCRREGALLRMAGKTNLRTSQSLSQRERVPPISDGRRVRGTTRFSNDRNFALGTTPRGIRFAIPLPFSLRRAVGVTRFQSGSLLTSFRLHPAPALFHPAPASADSQDVAQRRRRQLPLLHLHPLHHRVHLLPRRLRPAPQ